jgi:dienelactone hydrolase
MLYEAMYANQRRTFAIPDTSDRGAWEAWRAAFTVRLTERLGGFPPQRTPIRLTAAPPTVHAGYTQIYLEFESTPGVTVPSWLLIPGNLPQPAPAVIAIHGHGYGMDDVVGINPDGTERTEPQGYHQDFAVALCRRGMVVIAPEMLAFGRRRELRDQAESPDSSSCKSAAWWGIMLGKPLLGRRVWDVMRTIDLLVTLPEVDPQRIGIMGISGGGTVALFAAALDPRLRAAVISGYLNTFRDSILAMDHCPCNYVPGLLQDAEMYDIAALIAPRPLLIEAGKADHIFPLPAVLQAYEHVQSAYAVLGAADRIDKDVFEGGHQISGAKAYDFLWHRLTHGEPNL